MNADPLRVPAVFGDADCEHDLPKLFSCRQDGRQRHRLLPGGQWVLRGQGGGRPEGGVAEDGQQIRADHLHALGFVHIDIQDVDVLP